MRYVIIQKASLNTSCSVWSVRRRRCLAIKGNVCSISDRRFNKREIYHPLNNLKHGEIHARARQLGQELTPSNVLEVCPDR
jgi:hypothetical protein